jgi:hypothetical protein
MSARVRQSFTESTQRRAGNAPPPYEKPSFPLNPAALRAIEQLTRTHKLNKLDSDLLEAQAALSTTAGDINDRLYQKELAAKKRKTQNEQSSSADPEAEDEIERNLEEFRSKVEKMTQRMDESMRKMIDAQHSVQAIKESIGATSTDAATQASTQQARTQQYEDFQPTDPAAGTQDLPTPIEAFRSKTEDAKTRYQANSLTARYAENNNYRDFRRVVHDARHPEGDVQLPHHSEWFEEGRAPAPGMTGGARRNEDAEDSDDDIAVQRTVISTTCPLTLAEFKDPLTSKKCPHSFEAQAILSLIRRSGTREGGRGSVQVHQCPVGGCSKMLSTEDLHKDAVLIRQIKRLQRARELEQEEEDDEDGRSGGDRPTVIDDDAEDVDDIIEGRSTQVKRKPRTQRGVSKPTSTVRGSRATPMNVESGDEDETDDDDTMND